MRRVMALAAQSLVLMRETAARRHIRLHAPAPPAGPVTLPADERRAKQVLFNLISNAIKFTPEGGAVTVSVRRVDGAAEVCVADTGIGLPPGERERIFESFYQVKRPGAAVHLHPAPCAPAPGWESGLPGTILGG